MDNAIVGMPVIEKLTGSYLWEASRFIFDLAAEVEIMVKINGTEYDLAGKTLTEYLESADYDRKRIAVERNGEIVPKAKYDETVLENGDELEVVSFVGGG